MKKPEPIFIFSLPRSGSTLLQRILNSNKDIATTSEPWVFLPFSSFLDIEGVQIFSNFSMKDTKESMKEFFQLEKENDLFYENIRDFISSSYRNNANFNGQDNRNYFLDKTPRYYLMIDFIEKTFPNCKKIFLIRDLSDIYNSIFSTWYDGNLQLNHHFVDISLGPEKISEAIDRYGDDSILINYDNLIENPQKNIERLANYLELESCDFDLDKALNTVIQGKKGDPTGQHNLNYLRTKDNKTTIFNSYIKNFYFRFLANKLSKKAKDKFCIKKNADLKIKSNGVIQEIKDIIGLVSSNLFRFFSISLFIQRKKNNNLKKFYKLD